MEVAPRYKLLVSTVYTVSSVYCSNCLLHFGAKRVTGVDGWIPALTVFTIRAPAVLKDQTLW